MLKKALLPAALIAAIAVGTLSGCVTTTTETASTPTASVGTERLSLADYDIPQDIPYLKSFTEATSTKSTITGNYTLELTVSGATAVADAGKTLKDGGFTTADDKTFTNSKWNVKVEGSEDTPNQVKYTIDKV